MSGLIFQCGLKSVVEHKWTIGNYRQGDKSPNAACSASPGVEERQQNLSEKYNVVCNNGSAQQYYTKANNEF